MLRRHKVLLALLGALLCLWFVYQATRSRGVFETKHHGYTLVQWQEILKTGSEPERQQARTALVVMCSNNLPELIAVMEDDPFGRFEKAQSQIRWLPAWLQTKLLMSPLFQRHLTRFTMAKGALDALGSDAAFAVPEIERLAHCTNSTVASIAFTTLPQLGTNGTARFLSALDDNHLAYRLQALQSFRLLMMDSETNGFQAAIPALLRSTQSTNAEIVMAAAQCLAGMHSGADVAVPALLAMLPRVFAVDRVDVLEALGEFGPSARAALPALIGACNDSLFPNREAATNALEKIAPEVLTNGPASPPR